MPTRARPNSPHVTIVSDNPETLRGLLAYFDGAGVSTHGTRSLGDLDGVPATTTAVVLFPDDFAAPLVLTAIAHFRRTRPRVLLLLVTREPQALDGALAPDGRSLPPLVLPKPAFGWTILDAIRMHTDPLS
jgi:hypothetical protein